MNRKTIPILIAIGLAAASIYGFYAFRTPRPPEVQPAVKVGIVIPQTGPGAPLGKLIKRGLELGAAEVNARPGGVRIEYVFEDSKTVPAQGLTAFRKLVDADGIDVVLVGFSAVCNAVAPAAEESNVLMIGMTTSMPGLTENRQHVIRLFPNADELAGSIASFAESRYKRVAVLYAEDEYGKTTFTTFSQRFVKEDRQIVFSESFKPTELEFRTTVGKMLEQKPDALYLPGYGPGYINLLKQIRERDETIPILSDSPLTNPPVYKAAGAAAEGVVVPATPLDAGRASNDSQKAFLQKYQQAYGENPSINVSINYDFTLILADALTQTDRTPAAIRAHFLKQRPYHGMVGTISYRDNGESIVEVQPMRISQGTIVPIE